LLLHDENHQVTYRLKFASGNVLVDLMHCTIIFANRTGLPKTHNLETNRLSTLDKINKKYVGFRKNSLGLGPERARSPASEREQQATTDAMT
jgi:hypothetical protein